MLGFGRAERAMEVEGEGEQGEVMEVAEGAAKVGRVKAVTVKGAMVEAVGEVTAEGAVEKAAAGRAGAEGGKGRAEVEDS